MLSNWYTTLNEYENENHSFYLIEITQHLLRSHRPLQKTKFRDFSSTAMNVAK